MCTLCLPPIELYSLIGDQSEWLVFYKNFKSNVHDNPSLLNSERVQYLVGKVTGKPALARFQ